MTHIAQETITRLFDQDRDPDVTMCVHAAQTNVYAAEGGQDVVITRVVGHVLTDTDDDAEIPPELCLVVDLPMDAEGLSLAAEHLRDSMDTLMDKALEALTIEGD